MSRRRILLGKLHCNLIIFKKMYINYIYYIKREFWRNKVIGKKNKIVKYYTNALSKEVV